MSPIFTSSVTGPVEFPVLSLLPIIPAVGAVLIALVSSRRAELAKLIAGVTSITVAAMTLWLLAMFNIDDAGFQFAANQPWIENWGIGWNVGLDGISLFLVVLTGILFPLAILGIDPHNDDPARDKPYFAWILLLEAGVLGSFISLDLFLFFVFFEIVLAPMYFLIGGWGHGDRVYAATKFFLYTMFGSAFMLVALISTALLAANNGVGYITFDLVTIAENADFAVGTGRWLFLGFAIAFAVKTPIFPLHTWLSDAHTQAPTAGSVILAGVMLKMGTYGLLRFGVYLFPEAAYWSRHLWLVLAVIGIVYGAVVATMQTDLKRLVAYSSVAHLGFIVLGTFAFTSQSLTGSVLQNINHGLTTGALFFMVGMLYERRHTRIIGDLGGIQRVAPVFAGLFLFLVFASVGVPGLNGFIGEYLILIGSFLTARWYAIVGATGVILAALYLVWAYQRVFHGPLDDDNRKFPEIKLKEVAVLAPLVVLIIFIGIYPKPLLERIEPAVDRLVAHVVAETDYVAPVPPVPDTVPADEAGTEADIEEGDH